MAYPAQSPTEATTSANRAAAGRRAMDDRADFELADRGLIAPLPGPLHAADGRVLIDPAAYAHLADDAPCPDSVDPGLWRQSQILRRGGLYRVVDGIYQVRGNDIANLTVVEGDDGLVIVDCTTSVEAAKQGMDMIREHVSDKPVVAVLYTHPHVDHFGGVEGVVDAADVASGKVPILAPGSTRSFGRHAIGERLIAGNVRSRRAAYAFGTLLDRKPTGHITCGIGIDCVPGATISYIPPTEGITETGTRRTLAGLEFEFLYAPETEAPEEMHIWIPGLKALTCAENANHTLHDVDTLRGARTGDARDFARYLDETLERWGATVEVHFGPHTWPVWGNADVVDLLESQRDTYKYIYDQALRMANQGFTPLEAAEAIELPEALGRRWHNRGYHGTPHHDVRAVFHRQLGVWDGDPVSLHPHPPVETARRFLALLGPEKILAEGRRAVEAADYRWAAQVLHLLVSAQPENHAARELQADAYEQMGYQAEAPQWRAIFLTAARELREGVQPVESGVARAETIATMPVDILFDYAAVHVDGKRAAEADLRIDFEFTDQRPAQWWTMWVRRGVLNARRGRSTDAKLALSGPKTALADALLRPAEAVSAAEQGRIALDGDAGVLEDYAALLVEFDPAFPIVTP